MSGFAAKIPGMLKGLDASGLRSAAGKLTENFTPLLAGLNAIGGEGFRKTTRKYREASSNQCRDLVRYDPGLNSGHQDKLPTLSKRMASFGKEVFDNPWDSARKSFSYVSPLMQAAAPATQVYRSLQEVRNITKDPDTKGMRSKAVSLHMASAATSGAIATALFSTGKTEGKIKFIDKKSNTENKKARAEQQEIFQKINEIKLEIAQKYNDGTLDQETHIKKTREIDRLNLESVKLGVDSFKLQADNENKKEACVNKFQELAFKNMIGNFLSQGVSRSADKFTNDLKQKSVQKKRDTERKDIIENPEKFLKGFKGTLPQLLGGLEHDQEVHDALLKHVQNKRNMFSKANIESTLESFEGDLQDLSDYVSPDHELFKHVLQHLPLFPSLSEKFGIDVD